MKKAVSAGGISVRKLNDRTQILLLKYPNFNGYSFPKGHVDQGESFEDAAMREMEEETGLKGFKIVKKLGVVTRSSIENDGTGVEKDIHLYLMDGSSLVKSRKQEEDWNWYDVS